METNLENEGPPGRRTSNLLAALRDEDRAQLQGLLPICSCCKKIRNDSSYWERVERCISWHTDAQFSHGICPACLARVIGRKGLNSEGLENVLPGEGCES